MDFIKGGRDQVIAKDPLKFLWSWQMLLDGANLRFFCEITVKLIPFILELENGG